MKKKLLSMLLVAGMTVGSLAGCGGSTEEAADTSVSTATEESAGEKEEEAAAEEITDYGTGDIKVWVPEATVDFTNSQIDAFKSANPQFDGYNFSVEAVGEGDAANNVITDVDAAADVFTFAQDQLARLVSVGGLESVAPENEADVKANNAAGAVNGATMGDTLYAYPITADNTYFLYYDKSVVTDPTSLEKIIADCEAAKKNFYFQIDSGWYTTAFFFGTGCNISYDTDDSGNFTACNIDYATDKGLAALKAMLKLAESKSFQNGSSISEGSDIGAIVDGTWDSEAAKSTFGDNFGVAVLPSFTDDAGNTYDMSGFGGYKLLGVKPQTDELKLAVCDALAAYLSSEEVQIARFEAVGWGPSNINAQKNDKIASDEVVSTVMAQMERTKPQGQYPSAYWDYATAFGGSIVSGDISTKMSDDDLMKTLTTYEDECKKGVQ